MHSDFSCVSAFMTTIKKIDAATTQRLVPGLGESAEESMRFFMSLSQNPEFIAYFRVLFPWLTSPCQLHCKLWQFFIAARTDGYGSLQFGTSESGYLLCSGPNPWFRSLLFDKKDRVASFLIDLITKVYQFARPAHKIIDAEWAGLIHHRSKFEGLMILNPALEENIWSYKILVHVRMHISSHQEHLPLFSRDVELEVVFQTDIEPVPSVPVSCCERKPENSETLANHCKRNFSEQFRSTALVTATAALSSPTTARHPSDSGRYDILKTVTAATPMVRLNASSFVLCHEDDQIEYPSTASDEQISKSKVWYYYFYCASCLSQFLNDLFEQRQRLVYNDEEVLFDSSACFNAYPASVDNQAMDQVASFNSTDYNCNCKANGVCADMFRPSSPSKVCSKKRMGIT